jgi:hypothetical protein
MEWKDALWAKFFTAAPRRQAKTLFGLLDAPKKNQVNAVTQLRVDLDASEISIPSETAAG